MPSALRESGSSPRQQKQQQLGLDAAKAVRARDGPPASGVLVTTTTRGFSHCKPELPTTSRRSKSGVAILPGAAAPEVARPPANPPALHEEQRPCSSTYVRRIRESPPTPRSHRRLPEDAATRATSSSRGFKRCATGAGRRFPPARQSQQQQPQHSDEGHQRGRPAQSESVLRRERRLAHSLRAARPIGQVRRGLSHASVQSRAGPCAGTGLANRLRGGASLSLRRLKVRLQQRERDGTADEHLHGRADELLDRTRALLSQSTHCHAAQQHRGPRHPHQRHHYGSSGEEDDAQHLHLLPQDTLDTLLGDEDILTTWRQRRRAQEYHRRVLEEELAQGGRTKTDDTQVSVFERKLAELKVKFTSDTNQRVTSPQWQEKRSTSPQQDGDTRHDKSSMPATHSASSRSTAHDEDSNTRVDLASSGATNGNTHEYELSDSWEGSFLDYGGLADKPAKSPGQAQSKDKLGRLRDHESANMGTDSVHCAGEESCEVAHTVELALSQTVERLLSSDDPRPGFVTQGLPGSFNGGGGSNNEPPAAPNAIPVAAGVAHVAAQEPTNTMDARHVEESRLLESADPQVQIDDEISVASSFLNGHVVAHGAVRDTDLLKDNDAVQGIDGNYGKDVVTRLSTPSAEQTLRTTVIDLVEGAVGDCLFDVGDGNKQQLSEQAAVIVDSFLSDDTEPIEGATRESEDTNPRSHSYSARIAEVCARDPIIRMLEETMRRYMEEIEVIDEQLRQHGTSRTQAS
eukprot:scaffold323_cov414-Prasinococcus_capsulatus_cf.AAC.59